MKISFMRACYVAVVAIALLCTSHMAHGYSTKGGINVLDYSDVYFDEPTETSTNSSSAEIVTNKGGSRKKGCPSFAKNGGDVYIRFRYEDKDEISRQYGADLYEDDALSKKIGELDAACFVSDTLTEVYMDPTGICTFELAFFNKDGDLTSLVTAAGVAGVGPNPLSNFFVTITGGILCNIGARGMISIDENTGPMTITFY